MMKFANDKKKAWLILLIDFNKAFDSISHDFLTNALELMGFGEDMREWIKIFFNTREANVIINGHLSSTIKLQQGVPQGDVVSPYIFLLMVEILLIRWSLKIYLLFLTHLIVYKGRGGATVFIVVFFFDFSL